RLSEWDLPTMGKNLYIDLMQKIVNELSVSNCWICGGSQMTEQWPWRGEGVDPRQLIIWNNTHKSTELRPEGWLLTHQVLGQMCISREG
ncbi:ENR1 protein, partial [Eolophus roseicapillus]|nr:ENR1 protein [Eolophus roseicapilla]